MTPPEGEDNLLGPIEDVQLPVDVPTLYRGPSIDLRFACKSQQKREPTSGLEPLTPALATSVRSVVAERCIGLRIPYI